MKQLTTFIILLICCGIGYTMEEGQVGFTASVPCRKGSIQMRFLMDKDWGWGCGTGSQEYNCPCIDANAKGEFIIPDSIITPNGEMVSINWISRGSFQSCPGLTKIHIPNTIKNISDLSFAGCSSLREITLPKDLVCIYPQAFIGCISLRRVRFLSIMPPRSYYNDTFDEATNATATLVIPAETAEYYLSNPLTHRFRYHAEILPLYKETH